MRLKNRISTGFLPLYAALAYSFFYIPIAVLVVFSFNSSGVSRAWHGFSTRWYEQVWQSSEIWDAVAFSCKVGVGAVLLSLLLGTLLVVAGDKTRLHSFIGLFYLNVAVPEIVMAVGLLSLFYALSIGLGAITIIIAHALIGLGYCVPILYNRFVGIDKRLVEAAQDLGATPYIIFRSVIMPLMLPSLLVSGLLVFVISWDDFVLSFFCSGPSAQTLPMLLFSMLRSGQTPMVASLSTLLLGVTAVMVVLFMWFNVRFAEK